MIDAAGATGGALGQAEAVQDAAYRIRRMPRAHDPHARAAAVAFEDIQ